MNHREVVLGDSLIIKLCLPSPRPLRQPVPTTFLHEAENSLHHTAWQMFRQGPKAALSMCKQEPVSHLFMINSVFSFCLTCHVKVYNLHITFGNYFKLT